MEAVLISRLNDIVNSIQTLTGECSQYNIDTLDEQQVKKLEVTIKKLESLHSRFSSELNNYFRLSTEPSADDISRFSTIQLQSEEILIEMTIKLKELNKVDKREEVAMTSKLPKLDLPKFNGDILQWQQFYDHFNSSIGNRNLADVDKFMYLRSLLTGDALKTIEGLEITHRNYQIAMQTLLERYGKPSHVIDAHYAALYKVKAADMTVIDCRRALNEIERHIRVLQSLGENTDHSHLRFIIVEKFPVDIVYEMKKSLKTDSVEDIRKQLEIIISAKEDANRMIQDKKETSHYTVETLMSNDKQDLPQRPKINQANKTYKRKRFENHPPKRHLEQFRTNMKQYPSSRTGPYKRKFPERSETRTDFKKKRYPCIFCQGEHNNEACRAVTTLEDKKARLKDRCYLCLARGHLSRWCNGKSRCKYCEGRHNGLLCPNPKRNQGPGRGKNTRVMHTYSQTASGSETFLQTAVVKATHVNDASTQVKCRLLMDSGSQRTYITKRVAKELNLPIEEEQRLIVYTFGADKPQEYDSPVVKLRILTRTNSEKIIKANVVFMIAKDLQHAGCNLDRGEGNLVLADDGSMNDKPVDILIGNDYFFSLIIMEKIEIKENLHLVNSKLGWILSGKNDEEDHPTDELTVVTYFQSGEVRLQEPDLPLNNITLKSLWDLESIGITDSPNTTKEEEALNNFNNTTKYKDGRYSVSWPWKSYPPDLPTNRGLVQGRLISMLKRLDKDSLISYDNTIRDQLNKGIIEEVPAEEILQSKYPVHYLPFHGVTAPGKPARLVYDAAAKLKDAKSLNECLLAGPILLEDLTGLLIRFRFHKVGLTADVEKAFLQIALEDDSKDVTRFIWIKDVAKPATEDNILYLRFCRVPFGIISSPFILNATIKHHLMKSIDKTIQRIAGDIYVDNLLTGTTTTLQAITLYHNLKKEFQSMAMNLREWASNSKEFMQMIPDSSHDVMVKVLGLDWNTQNDTIQLRHKDKKYKPTKRGILKTVASVYDPCGYAVPSLLAPKLFLQELWKDKVKWDAPLSKEKEDKWTELHKDLSAVQETLPRYYVKDIEKTEVQLHCFTDASIKAYAAVVYIVNENGVAFVMGKSRLVPIKEQENLKIPRLELLGALIGSRLLKYVESSLKMEIKHQFLWTDSQIVIDWFNSDKLLTPFVSRRIEEIKKCKKVVLRYVPTHLNPADIATRPITRDVDKSIWLNGPDFLTQPSSAWPVNLLKEHSFLAREDLSVTEEVQSRADAMDEKLQSKETRDQHQVDEPKDLSLKEIQERYFPDEMALKETSLSRNLKLFKSEDGLLRCRGRLENADCSYDKKYPILLPKNSEYTNDLILRTHRDNYHVGASHTLSIIRQKYWIPQGKAQVQKILRRCPRCVKHGGGPFKLPPTPALPAERVNYSSPFTFTGLDYLGPILVSTSSGTEKRWICLFTCLAVRAIHLEIVKDLSAEEGLLALRRMVSVRGIPAVVTSDNATQFKLMSEILSSAYCIEKRIVWKFIPQLAPWFGGFYERLVALVKLCLKRTLQKHLLNDNQMLTVIKEIEAILNTRPLTCVDSEMVHILTPADFLTMGKCLTTEMTCNDVALEGTTTKLDLINGWKRALKILDEFKMMFMNRYLLSLRERYSNSHKESRVKSHLEPQIGQVVQIKGDNKNRENWKVGKITELVKSSDGLCRVAKVQVGDKEFTRSISQLYPLEVDDDEDKREYFVNKEIGHVPHCSPLYYHEEQSQTLEARAEPEAQDTVMEDVINNQNDDIASQLVTEMEIDNVDINESDNNERSENQTTIDESNVTSTEQSRPVRAAATRALEKIREWTRALVNIF